MRQFSAACAAALVTLLYASPSSGQEPSLLDPMFQDHAVLQRDRPVPVWGTAAPNAQVTVVMNGQTVRASADASGHWRAELPAAHAGGPYTLTASLSSGASQTASDVLVGDVWLCSGQSNMELPVSRSLYADDEIRRASNDRIRLLTVGKANNPAPLDAFASPVRWQAVSPTTIPSFSAACYYFARELQKTVNVPMGLIHSSWGGSNIEAWISANGLKRMGGFENETELLALYSRDRPAAIQRMGETWQAWWQTHAPAPQDEPWQPTSTQGWSDVPGLRDWKTWGVESLAHHDGMVWFRTTVTLTAAQAAQAATVSLGAIDEVDQTWINGRPIGNSFGWAAPRTYDVPAGTLKPGTNLLVVNVLSTWDKGGMYGPAESMALHFTDGTSVAIGTGWQYRQVPKSVGLPPRGPWHSIGGFTTLYNGMIAPLGSYALRGALWYQGETNADNPGPYEKLLTGLMADWRSTFGADLPFLIVQLPNFGPAPTAPVDSGWASLRDAQRRAVARDAHAGLVVTIDIGDRNELHPPNKQEIGRRLARAARHVVYGEAIAPSGPAVVSAARTGSQIVVTFGGIDGTLVTYSSNQAIAFEVCGADQASCRFVPATIDGARALIDDPAGTATRVRYCWGDGPECNLYDTSGLPAGPFEVAISAGAESH